MPILGDTQQAKITLLTCLEPNGHYRIATIGNLKHQWSLKQMPPSVLQNFDLQRFSYNF